ncbi:uncharacterized protein LOC120357721 [Solenopsis invicta]|uniref:uncharacterized protein LOC120357721 n=1 Tax=Solenopsis invicta TaxID=13686 RepID=UPI00193CB4F5|nr:uncharacterized protein LOC120357721 [Solenopsis invicta]
MANYYVPIQAEACEKKLSPLEPKYTPRILGRRFALTPTAYKYLDIGISAGPISFVELIIGDNRGNQIILLYEPWKAVLQRRADIEQLVHATAAASLTICNLTIQVVNVSNGTIVKLTSCGTCMYMKPSTILFLLEIEHCVEHAYYQLYQNIYAVNEKYKHFVSLLRKNCVNNKCDAAKLLREMYDKTSLIDCELLMYALDNIVYNALHV